ncbi:hypothetical protein ACFWJW_07865 [Streptomyces sp. NPDC127097]|uniref:hypothetical protein n=1 Tax=Streptomyces sp. NPDC127097 TaxID=3347136 RepID=UPI00364DC56F
MLNFLIGPAERYDLIVDFSQIPMGTKVTLTNYHAPVHYPGMPGRGPEISEIMQFQVTKPLSGGTDPTTPPKNSTCRPLLPWSGNRTLAGGSGSCTSTSSSAP